jgi:hypothetical protein
MPIFGYPHRPIYLPSSLIDLAVSTHQRLLKSAPIHLPIQRHRLNVLSRKLVDLLLMEMCALVNMAVSAALIPARLLVTRHVNTVVDVVLHWCRPRQ